MFEIEARGLTKTFGNFTAVRDLSLQIEPGSIFGFLGPNGSGKSTTVKMLTGLMQPTSGDAVIGGLSIWQSPIEVKRNIGVVPESLALFDEVTLWEHLTLCGPIYGLSEAETLQRSEELLRFFEIWEKRHTYADQSSHGMRKKTALAMALLHRPRVLFLDEPFEGIDPVSARSIREMLSHLSSKGVTVFLTSHILEIMERLATDIAIISAGQLVCRQTMREIADSGRRLEDIYFDHVKRPALEDIEWTR